MRHEGYNEFRQRGRFDFPLEFHHVDQFHPRFSMPYHWHIEYELIHILQGGLSLSLNETEIHAVAGDIVFVRDGIVHGGCPDNKDCVYECLVFDMQKLLQDNQICPEEIHAILEHDLRINNYFTPKDPHIHAVISLLFHTMQTAQKGYEFIVTGMLYTFIGLVIQQHLCHRASPHDLEAGRQHIRQIKEAFRLIDTSYDSPLTLHDLANAASLSPNYFCKFFQKITHKSPIDYLNYYRVETACTKLASSKLSITDIAYSCGFNDLSYFIKTFKRYKGTSPGKFRSLEYQKTT